MASHPVRAGLRGTKRARFGHTSRVRRFHVLRRAGHHERSTMLANPVARCFRSPGDRSVVAPLPLYPLRAIGHVVVELAGSQILIGVATLVSDFTVLTAGSLLKTPDNRFREIRRLSFVPAPYHVSRPYGIYDWSVVRAVYDTRRNWALISLTEPAGQSLGFLGTRADLPIRKDSGGHHATHVSFGEDRTDRMGVREVTVRGGSLDFGRRLVEGVVSGAVPGEPIVSGSLSVAPFVVGVLAARRSFLSDPIEFVTGYEYEVADGWMKWLCEEFGRRHVEDRFTCHHEMMRPGTLIATTTTGAPPNYSPFAWKADDVGPRLMSGPPVEPMW